MYGQKNIKFTDEYQCVFSRIRKSVNSRIELSCMQADILPLHQIIEPELIQIQTGTL